MEPLEYLRILRRRWPIPVVAVLIAVVAVWWITPATTAGEEAGPRTRTYTATHTLYQNPGTTAETDLGTMAVLATRGDIPRRVVARLDLDVEPAVLASEVAVSGDSREGVLTIAATHADGERAALVANTFAEEIVAYFEEQLEERDQAAIERIRAQLGSQLERVREFDAELQTLGPAPDAGEGIEESIEAQITRAQRDAILSQYQANLDRLQQLETREPIALGLYTLEEAVPIPNLDASGFDAPTTRSGRLPIAVGIALVLGACLALVLDRVDTRVRSRRGAESAFGLPVISEVPKFGLADRRDLRIVTASRPTSVAAEAYRVLRLSLQLMPRWLLPSPVPEPASNGAPQASSGDRPVLASTDTPARIVLVTSPGPSEGKTATVANLAASYAEAGKSVCVLDCDLRNPQLHRYFGTADRPGVTDFLASRRHETHQYGLRTMLQGVWLMPGGTPVANPGEILDPEQILVHAAAQTADVVIIDCAPLLSVNDPSALIPQVDAVVVVARSGKTSAEAAHRTRELLARLKAPVLGVALVAVPRSLVSRTDYPRRSGPTGRSRRAADAPQLEQPSSDPDRAIRGGR